MVKYPFYRLQEAELSMVGNCCLRPTMAALVGKHTSKLCVSLVGTLFFHRSGYFGRSLKVIKEIITYYNLLQLKQLRKIIYAVKKWRFICFASAKWEYIYNFIPNFFMRSSNISKGSIFNNTSVIEFNIRSRI